TNYDAAGNDTDHCYWKPSTTVGSCLTVNSLPYTNQPTQLTSATYDARNNRLSFGNSATGSTTTYDPLNNYQIQAFYLPTGSGKEYQVLYGYDSRHRLATVGSIPAITQQLCTLDTSTTGDLHDCTFTSSTGSDKYSYDTNDNRTTVNESNGAT